jgi:hypothetical protein
LGLKPGEPRKICLTLWVIFALVTVVYQLLGEAMRAVFGKFVLIAASLGFAAAIDPYPVAAADLGLMTSGRGGCSEIVFSCENGREYPLCPIAVSVVGEVVTASLFTSPRSSMHVRLVPMGVGYRYAGRGVWLDGFRGNALLNFGKHNQVACTIQSS